MSIPETGGRCGLDRDAALLFLFHEIGRRGAVMHFTDFVDLAGELKDPLGGCGFTCVNVSEDANISVFGKVFHFISLIDSNSSQSAPLKTSRGEVILRMPTTATCGS